VTLAEQVNHPSHYGGDTVYETIKVLEAWMTHEQFSGFCRGNAIKYLSRADKKGDPLTDLQKAQFYLDCEIQTLLFEQREVK
jgi:cytochrome c biogenesis protein ResB